MCNIAYTTSVGILSINTKGGEGIMEKAYEAAYSYKRMVRISDYGDMIEQLPSGIPNLPKRIPDILRVPKKKAPIGDSKNPLKSKT